MKERITLILLSLFSFYSLVHANNSEFSDHYKSNFKFSFVQNASADEQRTNYVLQQISFDNSISFQDLDLQLEYVLNVNVRRIVNQKSELIILLKIKKITGDTHIREIDVSKFLSPHICTFEYQLFNKQTGVVYDQVLVQEQSDETNFEIKRTIPFTLKKDELGFKFYGLSFYFSEQNVKRLKSHLSVIQDYYASASLADSLLFNSKKWRPDDGRNLVWNYFKINEFNRIHSIIKDKHFEDLLYLRKNDPAGLIDKLDNLSGQSRRLQTLIKEGARGAKLYFPHEVLLAQQIVDSQRQYEGFMKGSDFTNSRFLDELSSINYSNAWFFKIHSFFKKGLNKRQQARVSEYFERFVRALQSKHKAVAEQQLQSKKFAKAAIQIENAKRLNLQLNGNNEAELLELQSRVVYGLYHSYLSIAHRALSVPNVSLAKLYLDKALAYQKLNSNFIVHKDAITNAYRQLINELISKAEVFKMNQQLLEASNLLIEAVDICGEFGIYEMRPKIKTELHDIYKRESYLIMALNDKRLMSVETNIEQQLQKDLVRLKGSQQRILNQLERLNGE